MSLHPQAVDSIPEETFRVAHAAFPKGNNPIMAIRDHLSQVFSDEDFIGLYSRLGQPGYSPWRLILVCIFQFMENLSDRQAAQAVCSRIDWKYALSLSLSDPGFDFSILSEFRKRLVDAEMQDFALQRVLDFCKREGYIKTNSKQRTDSTHVLARIRRLNRLTLVGETLRAALNELAELHPEWLMEIMPPEWERRYVHRIEDSRFGKTESQMTVQEMQVGQDGQLLLDALERGKQGFEGVERLTLQRVGLLAQVWQEQFKVTDQGPRFKPSEELAPSDERITSPYDDEATFAKKRNTSWEGYKVHVTETCDSDQPHLITAVATTAATVADVSMGSLIQDYLEEHDLKPTEHLVDGGYISAEYLLHSENGGIEVLGPPMPTSDWQSRVEGGLSLEHFQMDWDQQYAQCPAGNRSVGWLEARRAGKPITKVQFSQSDCRDCPLRAQCTKSKSAGRMLTLKSRQSHELLIRARKKAGEDTTKQRYQRRAGIESTLSQGVRTLGLRFSRYLGLEKTTLQHTLTATALNFSRLASWWDRQRKAKPPRPRSALGRLFQATA
jgi:transposase